MVGIDARRQRHEAPLQVPSKHDLGRRASPAGPPARARAARRGVLPPTTASGPSRPSRAPDTTRRPRRSARGESTRADSPRADPSPALRCGRARSCSPRSGPPGLAARELASPPRSPPAAPRQRRDVRVRRAAGRGAPAPPTPIPPHRAAAPRVATPRGRARDRGRTRRPPGVATLTILSPVRSPIAHVCRASTAPA